MADRAEIGTWSLGFGTSAAVAAACSGRDLNPHAFRHTPLKRTCLPFHHPSASVRADAGRNVLQTMRSGKSVSSCS